MKRHLDFIVNNDLKLFFHRRAKIMSYLRKFLNDRDFLEVETPILNAQAGGALAKPFLTQSEALKQKYELRIAPELFLKQLIIGGYERVFEIGKVFRNEGIDATHNPEFTSIEFYMAYADYQDLFGLTEQLFQGVAHDLFGTLVPEIPVFDIHHKTNTETGKSSKSQVIQLDVSKQFDRYDVMENLGLDPLDLANLPLLRPKIRQMLFEDHYGKKEYIATLNDKQIFDKLIETRIESKIVSKSLSFDSTSNIERLEVRPAFIMNHPLLMSPLAKSHA